MNLGEIRSELYDLFGHDQNPDERVVARFDRWINSTYKELLAEKGFSKLRRAIVTSSALATDLYLVLPQAASRIVVLTDRTNSHVLDEVTIQDIRFDDPANSVSGSYPTVYVPHNLTSAVVRDPSVPSEIFVKSDNASDGAGQRAFVEVIRTGGFRQRVSVAMNGTTAVSLSSTLTTVEQVTKFYLASPAVGNVTLHMTSGAGVTLAAIPIGNTNARCSRLLLHPTPTVTTTYHADVELMVYPLEVESDEPILPEDFDFLLPCGAAMREFHKQGKIAQYDREKTRWRDGKANLKVRLAQSTGLSTMERGRRFSQLGGYYPVGS